MLDITGKIGPLYASKEAPEWPMYSFERGGYVLWGAIADEMHKAGFSEEKIQEWLQSKCARWAMDGELGEAVREVAAQYVKAHILTGENIL